MTTYDEPAGRYLVMKYISGGDFRQDYVMRPAAGWRKTVTGLGTANADVLVTCIRGFVADYYSMRLKTGPTLMI